MSEQVLRVEDVAAYLDEVGLQYMATIGLDGKPKVRPVQYMVLEEGRLWFCTNSQKAMYAELMACPSLEICGSRLQEDEMRTPWIRFSAEAVFEDNARVKRLILQKSDIVRTLYADDIDNPIFKVFYLKNVDGMLANLGHIRGLAERAEFAQPVAFRF